MAYKDEYEVARLHTLPGFTEKLAEVFEGDFKVRYYLAPPLLPLGTDARGRPRKRAFGTWMRPVFGGLARMKGLRGTWLDPFGHSAERRMERGLIDWYSAVLDRCAVAFAPGAAETWARILRAPMHMRGYGPVKAAAVQQVKAEVTALLDAVGGSA